MLPLGWTIDPEGNPITDPKEDDNKERRHGIAWRNTRTGNI